MSRLWIVGAGGAALQHWAVVRAAEERGARTRLAGFVVVDPPAFDTEGLAVRKEVEFLAAARPEEDLVSIAVGASALRAQVAARFAAAGFRSPVLVHPSAVIGPEVRLGEGTVVMALAVLETHVSIGRHGLVNHHASVAHEGRLGDFTSLGPGVHLAGRVTFGDRCDVGVGASARPGVRLGDDVIVGAGAVLVADAAGPVTLAGVPARPLRGTPRP